MKLSPEQLESLNARLRRNARQRSRPAQSAKPKPHGCVASKKRIIFTPGGTSVKKSGLDAPLSQTQRIEDALSKTQRIDDGPLAQALKSTYELGFAENALTSLRSLCEQGVRPVCFTLKGIAVYPFLFLADHAVYASTAELFWGLTERPFNVDATMEFDCESYCSIADETDLWNIFSRYGSNDKSFFLQAIQDIQARLQQGIPTEWVYFIGHDKRTPDPS